MSTTLETLINFLDLDGYRYTQNPAQPTLWLPPQASTLPTHTIQLDLSEDGELLRFTVPQLLNLADCPHRDVVLEALLSFSYRLKMLRFEYDPTDGEVRASIELPLEDVALTQRQFQRCLRGLVDLVGQRVLPPIQEMLVTGVLPQTQEPELPAGLMEELTSLLTKLQGSEELGSEPLALLEQMLGMHQLLGTNQENPAEALLQALLQAERTTGDAGAVHGVMRVNLGQVNAGLGAAMRNLGQQLEGQPPEQVEMMAGLLENTCISIRQFPGGKYRDVQEIAIAGYSVVLQLRQHDPVKRAGTLNNLGNAYRTLAQLGVEPQPHLQRAIRTYEEAIVIRRQPGLERDLSGTLNNLGIAYRTLAELGVEPQPHLQRAIAAYREALQTFKPTLLPLDCLQTGRNLGNLAFKEGWWDIALEGYSPAIAAVEQTRAWATDDTQRRELLENAILVYNNAIQCHLNLEQYDQAILLTERARSRHLVELMATNDAYKKGDIPTDVLNYLEQYKDLEARIQAERQRQRSQTSDDQKSAAPTGTKRLPTLPALNLTTATLEALVARKDEVWARLRDLDPVLAGSEAVPKLQLTDLQCLVDTPQTALLAFYSTNDDTHILILRHSPTGQPLITRHTCPGQGYATLQAWIRQQWLGTYDTHNPLGFQAWRDAMPTRLAELAQRLSLPDLVAQHLAGIEELILIPHILLHIIPFAALPLNPSHPPASASTGKAGEPEYLGDRFRLRYAPSAQVLKYCHDRPDIPTPAHPATVEDATSDLAWAAFECETIAQSWGIPSDRRLQKQAATADRYHDLLTEQPCTFFHSSHHAGSNLAHPLESGLLLSDRVVTLAELIYWRAPHLSEVFLSCCETNLGNPSLTDDLLTLGAGFLCAGARAVISTLWAVDDLASAIFCIFYYQQRHPNSQRPQVDRATTLQRSQQHLRNLTGADIKKSIGLS